MSADRIIIGTRGSDLALWQANTAAALIGAPTEIRIIRTAGDKFQDIALQGQLEQGFFTKEIERQLLDGEIDVAVHSLKDLPTQLVDGLVIGAHIGRAAVADLLVVHPDWHDAAARVPVKAGTPGGAMSLRRQALLRLHGPQAEAVLIRGNVPGRIQRCRDAEFGAVILARAGVERLGLDLTGLHVYDFNPEYWPPAPGQGVVGVEARANDERVLAELARIDNKEAGRAAGLERRLLASFEGGCHTAFGAWAVPDGERWQLLVGLEQDGAWRQARATGSWDELAKLGPHSGLDFKVPELMPGEVLCTLARW